MNRNTRIGVVLRAAAVCVVTNAALARPIADRTVVYSENGMSLAKNREWTGSSWSSEGGAGTIESSIRWVVTAACPVRDEIIAAYVVYTTSGGSGVYKHYVVVQSAGTWGTPLYLGSSTTSSCARAIDVVYEQASGDALLVHRLNSDFRAHFRTWNGSTWTADQNFVNGDEDGDGDDDMSTNLRWVNLVAKRGADEIMLVTIDGEEQVKMWVWNGSEFANNTLAADIDHDSTEAAEACYETLSGRCMVVWCREDQDEPRYRLWTGTAWLAAADAPDIEDEIRYARLAADPVSNKIATIILDDDYHVTLMVWNGSAWGSVVEVETNAPQWDRPEIGVCFEPQGTRAIAVWATSGVTTPKYRVYDGTSWGATQTAPSLGSVPSIWQLSPGASGQEILGAVLARSTGELWFTKWNGTEFATFTSLEASVAGANSYQAFMMTDLPSGYVAPKKIVTWQEADPH
jgi:hypothetical protein